MTHALHTNTVKAQLIKNDIIKKISLFAAILACVVAAVNM
jgi:hypothetical protein